MGHWWMLIPISYREASSPNEFPKRLQPFLQLETEGMVTMRHGLRHKLNMRTKNFYKEQSERKLPVNN
jgi:hypothetical protein